MFLKKQSWKDFSHFIKATKVETELLKETNKFLKNATNLNPLMKWYKKKYWTVTPRWLLIEAEIRQINIQIDWDWVHISWIGTDWVTYDEYAFFDYDSAKDMAELVAGTYIKTLEKDRDFYQEMIDKTNAAIEYAKRPPEDKKNAVLPSYSTTVATSWLCQTEESIRNATGIEELKSGITVLNSNEQEQWTKQRKQSKRKAQ